MNSPFALGLLLFLWGASTLGAPAQKPNVILILADDLGAETINAYGGEYFTPNIDRLAREGQLFVNAHATPLCTPTRVRLMTGRESAKNYRAFGYLDPKEVTIGNTFQAAGYKTAIIGKWQLSGNEMSGEYGSRGTDPQSAGFETSYLWQQKSIEAMGSRYWGPTISENGATKTYESGFGPRLQNDFALRFIAENKTNPFFLYVPMTLPHYPYIPTPSSPQGKAPKENFAGMIAYMDSLIGELLSTLEDEGLRSNTIVVFVADNGTGGEITSFRNGKPVQGGKGGPTVTGTNVPLIVSWPSHIESDITRKALFDVMDLFPTLADMANIPAPQDIEGFSQKQVLLGEKESVRSWIFMHYAPMLCFIKPTRFIFDTKWKLYGDGLFAHIDAERSSEVSVSPATAGAEGARRRATFQRLLDGMGDGPLESNWPCEEMQSGS